MQSQQKKVKWSRGETANALEERTDTGITQVSVSKLENIVSDIYGNISRRPAFKIITNESGSSNVPVVIGSTNINQTSFVRPPQSFVFTIDENTYIIFIASGNGSGFGGLLIQNNKFVRRITITNNSGQTITPAWSKKISSAQYNNFMVVTNLCLADLVFKLTGSSITNYAITIDTFQFSAPWYAPNGTSSEKISNSTLPGLEFNRDGAGFIGWSYRESNGGAVACSAIDTGLTGDMSAIEAKIPKGSIVYFPNIGAYMRVEGYTLGSGNVQFPDVIFDHLLYNQSTQPQTGNVANLWVGLIPHKQMLSWTANGSVRGSVLTDQGTDMIVRSTVSATGYSHTYWNLGSWQDMNVSSLKVLMYGELITPAVDEHKTDSFVVVETGYISLKSYTPLTLTFSNQRLYAAGFYNPNATPQQIPGYAIGSQIARYTDFNNNYNTKSEAIPLDISTEYQEKILYMVDYSGLKMFTDSAEYAVIDGAIVKQSSNGSLKLCSPIVFGSVCLYADKSGGQIRALQYELKNEQFASSSINQMAQEDLIFNTSSMAGFFDKEHYSGHFLFTIQTGYNNDGINWQSPIADHSMAVCNLVPGNQAMIWSRWTSPEIEIYNQKRHSIANVIEVNNKVWFIVNCIYSLNNSDYAAYTLAELDFDGLLDFEVAQTQNSTAFSLIPQLHPHNLYAWVDGASTVYTMTETVVAGDPIYNSSEQQIATAENSPGGPNITIDGVGYYAWQPVGGVGAIYTTEAIPAPTGPNTDPSRRIYNANGEAVQGSWITGYNSQQAQLMIAVQNPVIPSIVSVFAHERIYSVNTLQYTISGTTHNGTYTSAQNIYAENITIPGIISVFDGETFMWNDNIGIDGTYNRPLTDLANPRVGFMVNATLESHPLDINGKTYTEKKRIGKTVAVTRDTKPEAFSVCDKTGYMSPDRKTVNFYGCTGMKDQVRYTIKNRKGAKFTIESLTMIVEYGTLDS